MIYSSRRASSGIRGRRQSIESLEPRAYLTVAFATPVAVAIPDPHGVIQSSTTADFDGDGKTDLIIVASAQFVDGDPGHLYFAKGNGDGTFATPVLAATAQFSFVPAAGDFNGDHKLDLAVTDFGGNKIHLFTGTGNGTFAATATDFPTGGGPGYIRAADLNKDGLADAIVNNRVDNTINVRLGNASTILGPLVTYSVAGVDPSSFVTGDFNGDGNVDVLTANSGSNQGTGNDNNLTFFRGVGDGTLAAAQNFAGARAAVDVGDFNGDGKLDLVNGMSDNKAPILALGNGDGTFGGPTNTGTTNLAVPGDFDGDGKLDLLSGGASDAGVGYVLPGNGDATFGAPVNISGVAGLCAAADLNGDGLPDVIYAGPDAQQAPTLFIALAQSPTPTPTPAPTPTPTPAPTPTPTTGPNFTATISGTLPASVVGGAQGGKVSVALGNAGTDAFAGSVVVRLLASTDGTPDANDTEILRATEKVSLKAGSKPKNLKFSFNFPSAVADGSYTILAQVDPDGAVAETDESDNVAALATPVTIAAPFTDLAVSAPTGLAASFTAGKKSKLTVPVQNLGNVMAKGNATLTLAASTDGTANSATQVATSTVKVSLKPSASKGTKVSFTVPAGFAAGSYTLFVTLTPLDFTDSLNANNVVSAATAFVVG